MTKNSLICTTLLAAATLIFTSSKKENEENFYIDELQTLAHESLVAGQELNPDSLDDSMVIVSFWASYDPASRINNYDLLQLSDKFADTRFDNSKGLKVICVSLDTFRSPLLHAIKADGTDCFSHICDLQGEDSPLAHNFDVNRPVNLLLSPDGRILARDFGTSIIASTLEMLRQ